MLKVPSKLPVVTLVKKIFAAVEDAVTVTVPDPDAESKYASSEVVGTDAPLAPPDKVDQFVVLVQFPLPPETQNLFAITQ